MPTYEFKDAQTGEPYEMWAPGSECVEIGATTTIDGRSMIRVASRPQQKNEKPVYFTSMQLPQQWPYAKHFDDWGSPQFSSKKELTESLARANDNGESVRWNPD